MRADNRVERVNVPAVERVQQLREPELVRALERAQRGRREHFAKVEHVVARERRDAQVDREVEALGRWELLVRRVREEHERVLVEPVRRPHGAKVRAGRAVVGRVHDRLGTHERLDSRLELVERELHLGVERGAALQLEAQQLRRAKQHGLVARAHARLRGHALEERLCLGRARELRARGRRDAHEPHLVELGAHGLHELRVELPPDTQAGTRVT
ncbi:hypothetical protein PybrP1_006219 [[Pythium] brassicae (nom. inval.)]|nr:hypothetical protein PybrP1_006219 [[Pythium] brassicae (nom. inval.)]